MFASEPTTSPASHGLVVLGMHRSGTSATTGVLQQLGFDPGLHLMPANAGNPRGYFENLDTMTLNDALLNAIRRRWDDARPLPCRWNQFRAVQRFRPRLRSFLQREFESKPAWVIKDPRLCRLIPAWQPVMRELGMRHAYLHVLRHPAEVAESLRHRDGLDARTSGLLWLRHTVEAEHATRGCRRTWLHYTRLLADPAYVLSITAEQLHWSWPIPWECARSAVTQFLDSKLRRQRVSTTDAFAPFPQPVRTWVETLHNAFATARRDEDYAVACTAVLRALEQHDRRGVPARWLESAGRRLPDSWTVRLRRSRPSC